MNNLLPIAPPPGVFRRGTEYQSKGRVYDANLVRWYGPAVGPIGGWTTRGSTVTGKPRAIINWLSNAGARWSAVGTHSKLYAVSSGPTNFSIEPADFVAGNADASSQTGYGYWTYGSGTYGTARPDTGTVTPATVWDLDNWGQYLVACADSDGRILEWQLDTGVKAAAVSGAPTSCNGVMVTAQRSLVALGAGGNPRKVQWSDLENNTTWTPTATNKAGDFELATVGRIMCGRRMPDQAIILTDIDAWSMVYIGDVFVYGFTRVGDACGAMSRKCIAVQGQLTVWWGQQGFWAYDGACRPLPCDVLEYVQTNLNYSQRSKITCFNNTKNGEIWWFYPSSNSTENDSYVFWSYRDNIWNIGSLARTCAVEAGVFSYPLAYSSTGQGYEHETGSSYDSVSPYFRTGPMEIGNGERVARVLAIISDEITEGLSDVSFINRFYPNGDETTVAQTALSSTGRTPLRFTARQVEMKVIFDADNTARWGTPRLEFMAGGRR